MKLNPDGPWPDIIITVACILGITAIFAFRELDDKVSTASGVKVVVPSVTVQAQQQGMLVYPSQERGEYTL